MDNIKVPLQPFYMIRHGESVANKEKFMAGQLDSPLTSTGIKQAQTAAKLVTNIVPKPTTIIHSNLSRARDTAKIINQGLDLPILENQNIGEHNVGDWEGLPHEQCAESWRNFIDPPGGETFNIFKNRIQAALVDILNKYKLPLIVCHGGVFKMFGFIFNQEISGIQNCVLYEFTPNPKTSNFLWRMIEKP